MRGTRGLGCNSQSISISNHIWPKQIHMEKKHPLITPQHADMLNHAHLIIHVNRNTLSIPSNTSQPNVTVGRRDYIWERGNTSRLRWEVVDGGDMIAPALNFTQDCFLVSPSAHFSHLGASSLRATGTEITMLS